MSTSAPHSAQSTESSPASSQRARRDRVHTISSGASDDLVMTYGSIPVAVDFSDLSVSYEVGDEAVMSDETSKKYWDELYREFGAANASEEMAVTKAVMAYFCRNSSSHRAPFRALIRLNGRSVPSVRIQNVLGSDMRRFARANREFGIDLVKKDKALAREIADKYNCTIQQAPYTMDFVDQKKIPSDQISVASALRHNRLPEGRAPASLDSKVAAAVVSSQIEDTDKELYYNPNSAYLSRYHQ